MKRKILAGLLSLCMMVSLVPTAAFAEETTPAEGTPVVCAGVAETECLAEEHIEGCDKYVAPKATEEPAPTETPAEEPVVASLEEETPAPVAETSIAKIGDEKFATVAEAVEYAKNNNIKDLVITLIGETTAESATAMEDSFNLVYSTAFDSVTIKQEDSTKPYYIDTIYTGDRTATDGKFVFDGVNLVITSQIWFECDVELINNSIIKRTNDAKNFIYYGDVYIEQGSQFISQIDDIYGGSITVDGGKTDGTYSEVPGFHSIYFDVRNNQVFNVVNGAYALFNAVNEIGRITLDGVMNVTDSKVSVFNNIAMGANSSLNIDTESELTAKVITGPGVITIDATNLTDEKTVIKADMSGFTGTIEVINNADAVYEVADGKVIVKIISKVAEVNDIPYETLADAFAEIGKANGGDVVINILADEIDMSAWQGYSWNSYNASGANNVTVNGNGVKLTKMTKPLFLGTWTGKTLAINDITISEPAIVLDENDATGNTAVGAFVANVSCNESTVLTNCNVIGGSVTGGHWTGGLIGYAAGYSNQNDGPVFTTVTINDCTVEGVTISGKGSAGGIVGHATGDAWTKFDVQYATVTGNTITSTGSDTNKAGSIIGTIGAAGQPVFGKTGGVYVVARTSGNTVKSNNTAITTIYGRQGTSTGVLTVADGGYYEAYPVANDAYIADGCYVEKYYMENGVIYEVCKMDNIINTEAELKAALDGDAKTIKIECVEDQFALFTEGEFTVDREVIIDLNGEKIIWGNGDVKPEENNGVFHVVAGGKLTIIDSVGGGEILVDGTAKDDYAMAIWADGGEVIINAGIIRNNCGMEGEHTSDQYDLIYVKNGGKITINDGTFECWTPEWTLNKHDKTEGTIVVNGGRFLYYDPSCSTTENPTADFVAAGKHVCVVEGIIETDMGPETILYNEVHGTTTVAEKAATCTAAGTKAHYTCAAGTLFSDAAGKNIVTAKSLEIPATGHSFGGWTTTKGATCARNGEETRTCACGAAEVRETGKSSMHGYGADGKCATCGAADPNYVAPVATPAPTAAPTAKPTTAPAATPAPTATPEATPAPEMPKEADTTITEVVVKEEVVEAVKETVTVTEGTATVEKATVEAVIEATEEDAPVVLPLAQVTEETAEVVNKAEVATEALETVAEAEKDVVIELTDVTVMLDAEAVKAITEQADGETIEIRAVKTETHTLTEKQQATLADKDTAIVVTAQIFSDGEYIGDFKGGKATIMLPFQPEEGRAAEDYAVYFIDDHGELVAVPAEYVDGHMVFTTVHFSDYVIVYEGEAFGGSTEIVVPEAPAAESGFPVLPIAIVIAIIIIGGVIILMKKKNAEE